MLSLPSLLRTLKPNPTLLSSSIPHTSPRIAQFVSPSRVPVAPFFSSMSSRTLPIVGGRGYKTTTAVDGEVSLAKRLWTKSKREVVFATYSPFVLCLASGTLEVDAFRHYIAQDVHFLKAFAHAYEIVEGCINEDDDKTVVAELRKVVLEELKLHDSVAKEWGIDVRKEITPNSSTVKYTDFLLTTAMGKVDSGEDTPIKRAKVAAYTIGAMTPCMRLYAFLGQELRVFLQLDGDNHPYKQWIENYSDESFEASALQIENLLDKLSISLSGEELDIVKKLYNQAMRLEIEFFYMQPVQQTVIPLIRSCEPIECHLAVFSDFDLTCTLVDSCSILSEIAISAATTNDQTVHDHENARKSIADLRNSWDCLSSQYAEEYEQCMESILMSKEDEVFNYEGLHKAAEKLSEFEKVANVRVFESRLLKGLKLDDIKREGACLLLHNGCIDFFKKLVKEEELNADLHIISVCWCGDFIRAAFSAGGLDFLEIHSNELRYEGSISTGEIIKKLESPLDKVQTFKKILNSKDFNKTLSIYVGDSLGDLLCLLEADIGLVIGSNTNLRKVASHFGVSFVPLFRGLVNKQIQLAQGVLPIWKGSPGTLYTVSSWAEIHAFVLGAEHG